MNARPILFSGEMVRALLDGRKTQTRRALKQQPRWYEAGDGLPETWAWEAKNASNPNSKSCGWHGDSASMGMEGFKKLLIECNPYGQPGDLLYVRESWQVLDNAFIYGATPPCPYVYGDIRWKPSIHMPRRASRITLKITNVHVERVQDISERDALAEGVSSCYERARFGLDEFYRPDRVLGQTARSCFEHLWQKINGNWDQNPWVWVIEFGIIQKNVDVLLEAKP